MADELRDDTRAHLNRREFMMAGTTSLLALDGGVKRQVGSQQSGNDYQFSGVADLFGPRDARPAPDDPFFDDKVAFLYRYEASDTGARYWIQDGDTEWTELPMKLENTVDGHTSIANHTHIHRHLDELYFSGPEGVIVGVANATQDVVIQNPAGSGNDVEVIQFKMTASIGYDAEKYYNVDYPAGGTDISPWCLSDHAKTPTFNAKYGGGIADVGTADRKIPGGVVGGTKNNPTPFEIQGADIKLNPGETILFRTTLDSSNEDIAYLILVAEYAQDRQISEQ